MRYEPVESSVLFAAALKHTTNRIGCVMLCRFSSRFIPQVSGKAVDFKHLLIEQRPLIPTQMQPRQWFGKGPPDCHSGSRIGVQARSHPGCCASINKNVLLCLTLLQSTTIGNYGVYSLYTIVSLVTYYVISESAGCERLKT